MAWLLSGSTKVVLIRFHGLEAGGSGDYYNSDEIVCMSRRKRVALS
jgi:hypothetical protein